MCVSRVEDDKSLQHSPLSLTTLTGHHWAIRISFFLCNGAYRSVSSVMDGEMIINREVVAQTVVGSKQTFAVS